MNDLLYENTIKFNANALLPETLNPTHFYDVVPVRN